MEKSLILQIKYKPFSSASCPLTFISLQQNSECLIICWLTQREENGPCFHIGTNDERASLSKDLLSTLLGITHKQRLSQAQRHYVVSPNTCSKKWGQSQQMSLDPSALKVLILSSSPNCIKTVGSEFTSLSKFERW